MWTGGNDIAEEGVWVWPEDNMVFYGNSSDEFTDWDSGNVFLYSQSRTVVMCF